MKKLMNKLKIASILMLVLGLGGAAALLLTYFFVNFDSSLTQLFVVIGASLSAFVGIIYFFIFLIQASKIEKERHLTNLNAADIVGSDVGAAYDFGQIGLVVVDSNGIILWVNNFLADRGINLVDSPIGDFSPKLLAAFEKAHSNQIFNVKNSSTKINELIEDDDIAKDPYTFIKDGKYYNFKFISDANLFVLKDTTTYDTELKTTKENRPVFGYINLDNYDDIPSKDEIAKAQLETSIKSKINEFSKKYNTFVKLIRPDFYFIILAYKDFVKMRNDDFYIINQIADSYHSIGLTCSLGFGYGFLDFLRVAQQASDALDMALTRGGNQCVVFPFGEQMQFFAGANTESKGETSKVKILSYVKALQTNIAQASNILIVPHRYADLDAIGACLGVYYIAKSCYLKFEGGKNPDGTEKTEPNHKINICYDKGLVESNTDMAVRTTLSTDFISKVFVNNDEALKLKKPGETLIIMVDHNSVNQSIYADLINENHDKIVVIDHHRKQDNSVKKPAFDHVDSAASSTCEMLALYIDSFDFNIYLTKEAATFMLAGIYLDTYSFKQKTRVFTYEAAIILVRLGADEDKARNFLKENYEHFLLKAKIMSNVKTYSYGVLIACAEDDEFVDQALLASICQSLKDIESTKVAFAIGRTKETVVGISARSNGLINCETLMRKLNGGGHFAMAATQLQNCLHVKEAYDKLTHILDEYLDQATAKTSVLENNNEQKEEKENL